MTKHNVTDTYKFLSNSILLIGRDISEYKVNCFRNTLKYTKVYILWLRGKIQNSNHIFFAFEPICNISLDFHILIFFCNFVLYSD